MAAKAGEMSVNQEGKNSGVQFEIEILATVGKPAGVCNDRAFSR